MKTPSDRTTEYIAAFFLALMLVMGFFSMIQDSLTMDELSHIPAGYSYILKRDYRINPEHPPLIKDLAGLPLLTLDLKFPDTHPSWVNNINDQWEFGREFMWRLGNDADTIILLARLPMLLILLILGYYIFRFAKERGGNIAALVAVILYSFSPEFLAHGRLVTTDVGAAAGIFIATYYFLKFLKEQSARTLFLAGFTLGIALLLKFSTFVLIPYFVVIGTIAFLLEVTKGLKKTGGAKNLFPRLLFYVRSAVFILGIAFVTIFPVYQYHVWNYPPELQKAHTDFLLQDYGGGKEITAIPFGAALEKDGLRGALPYLRRSAADLTVWAADKPLLRPYAQWFLGFFMVLHRSAHGNATFFLGEITSGGRFLYFPIVYLIKLPLAFHVLTLLAFLWFFKKVAGQVARSRKAAYDIPRRIEISFTEFAMLAFIVFYWFLSLRSNLNIGVRHLLPTLPFLYILLGEVVALWLKPAYSSRAGVTLGEELRKNIKEGMRIVTSGLVVGLLLFWYLASTLKAYPQFIPYFNEIAGGRQNGYRWAVDSNLDWGQDFKRLLTFIEENDITEIRMHYFGGVDPRYYLGDRYIPWGPEKGHPPSGWFAISLTELQGRRAKPVKNYMPRPEERYDWLIEEPFAIVGSSIAVYKFE